MCITVQVYWVLTQLIRYNMRSKVNFKILLLFFLFIHACLFLQAQVAFSGYITDAETGEPLIGATLYCTQTEKGTFANRYGFFSFSLPDSNCVVQASFVGYQTETIKVKAAEGGLMRIGLKTNNLVEEVSVQATRNEQQLRNPEMGLNRLNAKQIETMPVFLGESDVLKAVQMLPGVSQGGEGTSGISVRGGSPDQTLILLDDVPVYNVNHLFGYFSVFNSQAIHDVTLLKGMVPARYGGRLSSVLDISMKEGNNQQFKATASIGTLAAKGTIEGPIVKGRGSYMLSVRKTWPDLPVRLYYHYAEPSWRVLYGFYDLNGKVNWRFSENDRVYLSFYSGLDGFSNSANYREETTKSLYTFEWGNYTTSLRWNHVFNPRLFSNFTAYYSRYSYSNENRIDPKKPDENEQSWHEKYTSTLEDFCLKGDFDYRPDSRNTLRLGFSLSHKTFQPEIATYNIGSADTTLRSEETSSGQTAELYAENSFDIGSQIKVNLGLRGSFFYDGQKVNPYLMPRVSLAWKPYDRMSFKAGYSRMVQHVHQLTNSSLSFPTDLWVTSTPDVPSSQAHLFSLGCYYIPNERYSFSAEAYYSAMKNVISYYPGTDYLSAKEKSWQDIIMQGNGRAFGIELMAEKKSGQLTGFVNYTWSRSLRSYGEIFDWDYFAYEYDRPHKLSALANFAFRHKAGEKYHKSLSASFTFSSGRLISLATAQYQALLPESANNTWHNRPVYYTPWPNNHRMSSFHHLDLSFTLESTWKNRGSWTFGVYNVYNHFNTSHYNIVNGKVYEVAIFPVMPFVSYSFKF